MDLFASKKNVRCSQFFSIRGTAPLHMTGLGNCIPSTGADPPLIGEGQALGSVSAPGGLGGLGLMEVGITPLLYNRTWCLSPLKVLLQ